MAEWAAVSAGGDPNYKSVSDPELAPKVRKQLGEEVEKRFVQVFATLAALTAVVAAWGRAIPSKLAAIPKKASEKLRIIQDLRRSGVNERCVVPERLVLPRLHDAAADGVALSRAAAQRRDPREASWHVWRSPAGKTDVDHPSEIGVEGAVIDIADAFKLIDVAPEERRFLAAEVLGQFYLWAVCVFGAASAPLVWGRMAALLIRLVQGMFDGVEGRANMYIDDILMQMCGTPVERTRQLACVLLLLAVLGFPVALHKVAFGPDLEWIGARFTWSAEGLVVSVPAKRRDEVLGIIERICALPMVSRKLVRELAGKLSSLAGIVPYLAAFNRSCHKVGAENDGEGLACTRQVAHDLRWAHSVLSRERGVDITRVYRLRTARSAGVVLQTDASIEGVGAVLFIAGRPKAYITADFEESNAFGRAVRDWLAATSGPGKAAQASFLGSTGEASTNASEEPPDPDTGPERGSGRSPAAPGAGPVALVPRHERATASVTTHVGRQDAATGVPLHDDRAVQPRHVAALEFLTVLLAVRAWGDLIRPAVENRVQVAVRTDSAAAMGAALTWRSRSAALNEVAKELCADAAAGLFVFDLVEHVPGLANVWADQLSHLRVPEELQVASAERTEPSPPQGAFWRTRADPPRPEVQLKPADQVPGP